MALIVGIGIYANALWANAQAVLGYTTSVSPTVLLQETNIQRLQHDSGALSLNSSLSEAAQQKANDMAARNYWSHSTPEGSQPWQLISASGYAYETAGENLAYGFENSSFAVAGWMNSKTHRDNLLNIQYKDVGFGIANSPDFQGHGEQTIIVALYATPTSSAANNQLPAGGAIGASTTNPLPGTTFTATPQDTRQVSRIDAITDGRGAWLVGALAGIVTLTAIFFIYRHGKLWHRYLVKGERFLIKHPMYDIAIVAAVVVSVILSRTSGTIH